MAKGRELEDRTLYGPAMAEYQREIKENPTNAAEAYYRIGVLSNQLGNTEGVVEQFCAAVQANPLQAEVKTNRDR
jgi:tetratricopeptide (TPR) repeat protein